MANEKEVQKQAVALRYDTDGDSAPKVVAKGRGQIAENILQTAQNNKVPVYQNKGLTQMLMALELDSEIPPELYQAVAEVLSYIYRTDKMLGMSKSLGDLR